MIMGGGYKKNPRSGVGTKYPQMVNNHGDRKSTKDRVVGPLPNGPFYGLQMGVILTTV